MTKCPAGPDRRQIAAARRARADLRRLNAKSHRAKSRRTGKTKPPTARQKAKAAAARRRIRIRIRRDRQAINKVRVLREKRKACLRAHRYALRTRNGQAGFVTAEQLAATRKAIKARVGRG